MTYDPYEGKTRKQYLRQLAGELGVPLWKVLAIAEVLGPEEDFDGLVAMAQDEIGLD